MRPLLKIDQLDYRISNRLIFSVEGLQINRGDCIHLEGASGIGKSLFGLSLIGFFAERAEVTYQLEYTNTKDSDWQSIRRSHVGYIFQQPKAYFNPVRTIGRHLLELRPEQTTISEFENEVQMRLAQLNLGSGEEVLNKYPHEFSIGQLQRIYAISALIRRPELIIADEPFAHLDLPTAKIVAKALLTYAKEAEAALLFISHEPPGHLLPVHRLWKMESNDIKEVEAPKKSGDLLHVTTKARALTPTGGDTLLQCIDVDLVYKRKFAWQRIESLPKAVDGIDLEIRGGDRIGFMGQSGSGKTSLALLLSSILKPTSGEIRGIRPVNYRLINLITRRPSTVQIVFQDPYTSFSEAKSIGRQIFNGTNNSLVLELLEALDLTEEHLKQYTKSLSGGELQRLALIRTLASSSDLQVLVLDESLSALDEGNRNQIMHLLESRYPGLAIVFISHRFYRLRSLCDRVYFLDNGQIVDCLLMKDDIADSASQHIKGLIH